MFTKRIFLARNEKKYKLRTVNNIFKKAQSTLEYALIFPLLFLMILGILELAMMWHQYNSVEMVANDISANIIFSNNFGCVSSDKALNIVRNKTALIQAQRFSFTEQNVNDVMTYTSVEKYKNIPFVVVKIDCSAYGVNGGDAQQAPSVQVQALHKINFFAISLPNLKTGKRIIIIPDNVVLVSTKVATLGQN